jgi:hypothetical protein
MYSLRKAPGAYDGRPGAAGGRAPNAQGVERQPIDKGVADTDRLILGTLVGKPLWQEHVVDP